MKQDLETLKNDFLIHLETVLGRSSKTVETYDRYLSRFLLQTRVREPRDITEKAVRNFFSNLCKQSPRKGRKELQISPKTRNYHRVALRMFLAYLDTESITSLDPKRVPLETVTESAPVFLTEEELDRLLGGYFGDDAKNRRDRAIVHTLAETGIKVSELCALNIDSYRTHAGTHTLVCGVGEARRMLPLSERVQDVLAEYCAVRKIGETPLFLNNGKRTDGECGSRLTPRSVQRIVREYGEKCEIKQTITPSVLRHSVANRLREKGTHISDMQNMLGHEQNISTRAYIRFLEKGKRSTDTLQ